MTEQTISAPESQPQAFAQNTLQFDPRLGTIYKIWLLNLIFGILTLGIYHFWGKTRMRRYLTHCYELLGDRFVYSGTGKELFIGFLKALPIILLITVPLSLFQHNPVVQLLGIVYWFLYYAAMYAAMRYRMSRITWRGIRGRLAGSAFAFGAISLGCLIAKFLTLGLANPWLDFIIYRYRAEHSYFGSAQARFDGVVKGGLLKTHFITWLLALPTFGLSRLWYKAALMRYQLGYTIIYNLRLRGLHTGGKYMELYSLNLLILFFTAGIGFPIVLKRNAEFFAKNVVIVGNIQTDFIAQSPEVLGKSGEGLESAMGIDAGFL